jgi:glutathione peroxidase-family protein
MANLNVNKVVVRSATGEERSLGDWGGQVLLIVNVASRCGFTRQYAGLQKLQDTYGPRGLTVLGGARQADAGTATAENARACGTWTRQGGAAASG